MTEGCFVLHQSCKELKCKAEAVKFTTNLLNRILNVEGIIPLVVFGVQYGLLINGYFEIAYHGLYILCIAIEHVLKM